MSESEFRKISEGKSLNKDAIKSNPHQEFYALILRAKILSSAIRHTVSHDSFLVGSNLHPLGEGKVVECHADKSADNAVVVPLPRLWEGAVVDKLCLANECGRGAVLKFLQKLLNKQDKTHNHKNSSTLKRDSSDTCSQNNKTTRSSVFNNLTNFVKFQNFKIPKQVRNDRGKCKKVAFTLAEVLITLGIIGIVAAMTMPALINTVNKRQAESRLKKAYAELSLSYKRIIDENGLPNGSLKPEESFNTYIAPYIKAEYCATAKECGYPDNTIVFKTGGGTLTTGCGDLRTCFRTPAGFVYFISPSWNYDIFVDINGGKLPNDYGKDVFLFGRSMYQSSNLGALNDTILPTCAFWEDKTVNNRCMKYEYRDCCAEKIRRAGWKMDSTYPW